MRASLRGSRTSPAMSGPNGVSCGFHVGRSRSVRPRAALVRRAIQKYVRSISALASTPPPGGGQEATTRQAAAAVNAAQKQIGTLYSWGGGNTKGPSTGTCCSPKGRSGRSITGFDCSGLTLYAYAQAGIHLPRTAAQQYAASEPVKPGHVKPGDLVFYGASAASIHHVGIYVGGGWMIDAPRPGTQVRYSPLDSMPDLFGVARPVRHDSKEI